MTHTIPTVVIGASGYVGAELLRLISGHPALSLVAAVSDGSAGREIGSAFGHLAQALSGHRFVAHEHWLEHVEPGSELALFSAAPHGASAAVIANAIEAAEQKEHQRARRRLIR